MEKSQLLPRDMSTALSMALIHILMLFIFVIKMLRKLRQLIIQESLQKINCLRFLAKNKVLRLRQ